MDSTLSAIKQPKIYIPILVGLLLVAGYLLFPRSENLDDRTIQNRAMSSATAKKYDQQKTNNMYDMINRITATYAQLRKKYPAGDSEGWDEVKSEVLTNDSFIDPYTNSIYSFADTNTNPDFGQIQYAPGKACDTKSNKFKEGNFRTIALRVRLYDTYKCISSVEVQARP